MATQTVNINDRLVTTEKCLLKSNVIQTLNEFPKNIFVNPDPKSHFKELLQYGL